MSQLTDAVRKGDLETVRQLLAKGEDPNSREGENSTDATALMRAAEGGHTEIAKLLLEKGADINLKWNVGGTALQMIAGEEDSTEMVRLLITHGADVNARDNYGQTALTSAAVYGRVDNVRLLLDSGADVKAQKNDGLTALTGAVKYGNTSTVELLLERGAPVSAAYGDQTTMALMALAKKPEIAALLMKAAREQMMKEGKDQESPRPGRPQSEHEHVLSHGTSPAVATGTRLQSKKWWHFWR